MTRHEIRARLRRHPGAGPRVFPKFLQNGRPGMRPWSNGAAGPTGLKPRPGGRLRNDEAARRAAIEEVSWRRLTFTSAGRRAGLADLPGRQHPSARHRGRRPTLGPGTSPQVPRAHRDRPWASRARPIRSVRAASWTRAARSCAASATSSELVNGHLGEIKATFYEEDNQIRVRKTLRRARHLRGPHLDRRGVLSGASRAASRAATSRPSATSSPPPRHVHASSTAGERCSPSTSRIAAT